MGKRRNAKGKNYSGGDGNTTSSNSYGGSSSNNDKLSAFDFNDEDLRVEQEACKTLVKYGIKSPGKKLAQNREPVDKYVFLEFFAQGPTQQKDSGKCKSNVHVTDCDLQDRISGTDISISSGSLNCESRPFSFSKRQPSGAKTCAAGRRKPGGYTTGKKHNKALYVDSDEDRITELRLSSSFDLADIDGPLEEQSSEHDANDNDCEKVVVLAPYYVKYGNMYYKSCILTFSQRCIRLEGSTLHKKKRPYCLEWPTFDILKIEHQQCESVKANIVNLQFQSKVINVDETGNPDSGSVELEFVVLDDPHWSEKQENIKSLDLKYKSAWKTSISECSFKDSFEDIIYPDGDPDAVFLSKRDIELLQPRTFINDTIIDFYIKYLVTKIKPGEQHRFHFFNTFFFQKLVNVNRDLYRDCEGRDAFGCVRKWTRNVNIFEKEYIFIPVNFSLHWSLIVICHPGEVANLRDKSVDSSSKVPCILHMDSIRGSHKGFEDLIRSYLSEEWKERGNRRDEDIATKFLNLDFVLLQLPQQENWFDCGLFLLHYAELFLEQASNFSATTYLDFLNEDWFFPAEVSLKKRDYIRKLIHRIVDDNALKDPPTTRDKCYQSGTDEDDSGVKFVHQTVAKDQLCLGINFNSCDDLENVIEQRNIDESVIIENIQPRTLLMPDNQFNNTSLPIKEIFDTSSKHETEKPMPPRYYSLRSSRREETKKVVSEEASRTCSGELSVVIDVQNEENRVCDTQVKYENSSMSSEDLSACVVEDSEEESEIEIATIRKTSRRRSIR
ncbi:hypothetical protein ACP275_02G055300 [Erythranthe tilingii]